MQFPKFKLNLNSLKVSLFNNDSAIIGKLLEQKWQIKLKSAVFKL